MARQDSGTDQGSDSGGVVAAGQAVAQACGGFVVLALDGGLQLHLQPRLGVVRHGLDDLVPQIGQNLYFGDVLAIRADRIERQLAAHPGLFLAGNAYRGIGVNDCVRAAAEVAPRVLEHLGRGSA